MPGDRGGAFALGAALLLALAALAPVGGLVAVALWPAGDEGLGKPWVEAWSGGAGRLGASVAATAAVAIPAALVSTALGAINGYALTQRRFRGDRVVFGLLLAAAFLPAQATLVPLARAFGAAGLGGLPGLGIAHVALGLGVSTLICHAGFAALPPGPLRAARLDGAGFFTAFRRVALPGAWPAVAACLLWQVVAIWNDYLLGATFAEMGRGPVTAALAALGASGAPPATVAAGALISALVPLGLYMAAGPLVLRGLRAASLGDRDA